MKKIIVACNSGLGTSLMIRLNVEALLKEWGLKAWVEHTDISSIDTFDADLIIGSSYIIESLQLAKDVEKIGVDDITDRHHLKTKLLESETVRQWLAG
ncbi:MAG: PTS sugar transporter subunit IIB [Paenibacillus sp.]|uniref:PTS sugar transporter subunit IIB n=1 Tax=Paenibacillus sp. TaxID=58172 RepID=UPI0025F15F45|nr:PTS sugar transporter subunit IIB [Paenibacillus sp.]MBR2566936.1 PTS sugar transporter subunit IIB [Paenibacillus sp.]